MHLQDKETQLKCSYKPCSESFSKDDVWGDINGMVVCSKACYVDLSYQTMFEKARERINLNECNYCSKQIDIEEAYYLFDREKTVCLDCSKNYFNIIPNSKLVFYPNMKACVEKNSLGNAIL